MAYEIEGWERDGARGESRFYCVRVRNLAEARSIFESVPLRARITLRDTRGRIWDLLRSKNRDKELDTQLRTLEDARPAGAALPRRKHR